MQAPPAHAGAPPATGHPVQTEPADQAAPGGGVSSERGLAAPELTAPDSLPAAVMETAGPDDVRGAPPPSVVAPSLGASAPMSDGAVIAPAPPRYAIFDAAGRPNGVQHNTAASTRHLRRTAAPGLSTRRSGGSPAGGSISGAAAAAAGAAVLGIVCGLLLLGVRRWSTLSLSAEGWPPSPYLALPERPG